MLPVIVQTITTVAFTRASRIGAGAAFKVSFSVTSSF